MRRLLVVCDCNAPTRDVARWIRFLARERIERLALVVESGARTPLLGPPAAWASLADRLAGAERALDALVASLQGIATHVETDAALELTAAGIAEAAQDLEADFIVLAPLGLTSRWALAPWWRVLLGVHTHPVAWIAPTQPPPLRNEAATLAVPFDGHIHSLQPHLPVLRAWDAPDRSLVFVTTRIRRSGIEDDVRTWVELAGLHARVRLEGPASGEPWALAEQFGCDALSLAIRGPRAAALATLAATPRRPLPLVAPSSPWIPETTATWSASDVVEPAWGPDAALFVEQAVPLVPPRPVDGEPVDVIVRGTRVHRATARHGLVEVPRSVVAQWSAAPPRAVGLARASEEAVPQTHATWIVPGEVRERVVLWDTRCDRDENTWWAALEVLRSVQGPGKRELWPVRLRPDEPLHTLRLRLREQVGPSPVLDAAQVLREGDPSSVPGRVDGIRLARVATVLRAEGIAVEAIVHPEGLEAYGIGFSVETPQTIAASSAEELLTRWHAAYRPPAGPTRTLHARLDALTDSHCDHGNVVELEVDNRRARRAVLEAIAGAKHLVALQVYIIDDDEVSRMFARALLEARARGVRVVVLVDSLYSLHGSYRTRNPIVAMLEDGGVEVAAIWPLEGIPTVEQLKRRDHRKLLFVDGQLAIVSGRNLGAPYYLGFDEVALTPSSPWREVPWWDAHLLVRGPAVHRVEESLARTWKRAGGSPWQPFGPPPARPDGAPLRFIVHEGLRDAHTLHAYLTLIDAAQHDLSLANSFPLHTEIIEAILRAVGRGVRVRFLYGNARPRHGDPPAPFPGTLVRELADNVVQSRIDVLVEAGVEVYEFALPARPTWDPAVAPVRAYVHAKLLTCDGQWTAVGSANLDVTAGYWESEALAVVHDPTLATAAEDVFDQALRHSLRIDPNDPAWRERARRRAWLRRYWPSMMT